MHQKIIHFVVWFLQDFFFSLNDKLNDKLHDKFVSLNQKNIEDLSSDLWPCVLQVSQKES
jgi:hypothetical protein